MRLACAAAASGLALLANPAVADTMPGEGFDVIAYALGLTPDLANKTVAGAETITLRGTTSGLRQLTFSGNALTIDSATLDGEAATVAHQGTTLTFDLPKALDRGQTAKLKLYYHGRPARGVAGSATSLYTSYFACDWMICLEDQTGDKALFSLDLRVPKGLETLSVGRLLGRRPGPDDSEIFSWRTSRPYSAYLFGFAVGRYARVETDVGGTRLAYMSDVAADADLERRFGETGAMVSFLSDKAGVPLPSPRYTQLLVDGDEAQEAATYSIIGKDELPTTAGDPAEDWVIVHELSHQWWGNLVTCATLRDFWLNEGITTFMTAAWKEHHYGRAAYDAELEIARGRLAKARAKGFDKPLAWTGPYPSLGIRRAVQYSKGALFMDHLRTVLGDAPFWAGLKAYTRAHAGGTVTSIDLEQAMEQASGRDLRAVFAEWVFGGDVKPDETTLNKPAP